MGNVDWTKAEHAVMAHEWLALAILAWVLSILLYVGLQIWFGCAWTRRWRVVALVPLLALVALVVAISVGQTYDPDVFGPPAFLGNVFPGLALLSPLGAIYLVVAGITHRVRNRRAAV
jgi:hypothetical protein